jgi:hypothetical protein
MTVAERREAFGAASFRIVPRLQKPAFGVGAHSRLVRTSRVVERRRRGRSRRRTGSRRAPTGRSAVGCRGAPVATTSRSGCWWLLSRIPIAERHGVERPGCHGAAYADAPSRRTVPLSYPFVRLRSQAAVVVADFPLRRGSLATTFSTRTVAVREFRAERHEGGNAEMLARHQRRTGPLDFTPSYLT